MFDNLLKGAAWSIGLTWLSRFIGLFSVIIVARILTPEDYGIVAIAMLIMHFTQNLSSAGASQYLIQKHDLSEHDIRTTWTLTIIFRLIATLILFLSSGALASYFNEPRLDEVFQILSLVPLFDAIKNINIFIEEKKINFKPVFLIGLTRKIVAFITSVTLALNDFNYWALIYGELVGCVFFVMSSYCFLPITKHYFKPSLLEAKNQFHFYSWSFLQIFIGFTRSKIDGLLMAKYVGNTSMGEYHLSSSLADIPSNELSTPITRPLYAGLAMHAPDSKPQIVLLYKSMAALSFTVFFLSFLLATTSVEVVHILLGEKWSNIPIIVSILSASYALYSSGMLLQRLLTVQGKVKYVFYLDCICLIIVSVSLTFTAITFQTLLAIAIAKFVVSLITLVISILYTARHTAITVLDTFKVVLPSFFVAMLSCIISLYIASEIFTHVFASLMFKASLYFICFFCGLYIWSHANSFKNFELIFINNIKEIIIKKLQDRQTNDLKNQK